MVSNVPTHKGEVSSVHFTVTALQTTLFEGGKLLTPLGQLGLGPALWREMKEL